MNTVVTKILKMIESTRDSKQGLKLEITLICIIRCMERERRNISRKYSIKR